ncbi:tRNA (adenosine(37)-N6)-threonylcarbamoyltransferase complex ATPase subunit type 1 TsaE [Tropicimonas marinistellae]|uniref:tRNA (adenosine(37)-N6)-threonylcarbamoyltransferase complex ATPase subunit type 1 TsaE n=1 Tax=Tropicimonas marinistellae TaxID=1739787 RepID=UPI00082BB295|nr:tRNA (adenosine(37)-N6)-threonylcarbamoyltransferase complex ATPase subunit type 1 TsaE [Tropicimonas marinistellae]
MRSDTDIALDLDLTLPGPKQTDALGVALAGVLRPGDTLLLSGQIGAGKSHLARAIIQSLQQRRDLPREDVPSPTYTLVQVYDLGDVEVWHADLYRLNGAEDVFELGLDSAFETEICLVEWPDRLGQDAPAAALTVSLDLSPETVGRRVSIRATDPRWIALERQLTQLGNPS